MSQAGCNITINSPFHGVPQGSATNVTISGTIIPLAGVACPDLRVTIRCGDQSVTGSATITGQNWTITLLTKCSCDQTITVAASCPALNCSATATGVIVCPQNCCPQITTSFRVGECDANGNRPVTFSVTVTAVSSSECPKTQVQMDFGDGSPLGAIHTFPPSGSYTETHTYAPGNFTPCVKVISPQNCPPVCVSLSVPKCCCPKLTTEFTVGDCDDAGKRKVCLTTSVVVPSGCEVTVQWDFGDGTMGSTHTFSPGSTSFTECHDYAPGSYTLHLNVLSPKGCPSSSVTVNVPPCPDCCPGISVTPCIEDCDKDGNRLVTFTIAVNAKPAPCPQVQVQMDFGDGNSGGVNSFQPSSSGSYIETHTYTGSAALQDNTAALNVIQPQGCPGWSQVIPKCCPPKRVHWCNFLFDLMTGSLALALVLQLLKWLCSIPIPTAVVLTLLGVFAAALLAYLFLGCPKCRCGWLYLLLWRVLSGVGLLLAIFAGCIANTPGCGPGCLACNHWTFWIGLGLLILGIVFLLLWKKKCCVKLCDFLKEIVLWVGSILIPLSIIIGGFGACLYILFVITWPITFPFTFWALVLFLWGIFLAYAVKNCFK